MFCKYCGKELRDGAAFCEYCGQRVDASASPAPAEPSAVTETPVTAEAPSIVETPAAAEAPVTDEKTVAAVAPPAAVTAKDIKGFFVRHRLWFVLAIGVLAVLLVGLSVVRAVNKRVDITRYLKVEATGYDGYGTLTTDFDYTAFLERVKGDRSVKAYGDAKKKEAADAVSVNSLSTLSQYAASEAERSVITNAVTIETTLPEGVNRTHLSNGDEVTFTLTFDKKVAKQFGVKVKEAVYTYTVSGLSEAETFDVMQYFSVAFSGIDGSGRATIKSTPAQVRAGDATFTIEENSPYVNCRFADGDRSSIAVYLSGSDSGSLHIGDTVKLTTNADEARFAEKGVILTGLSKEVRVENLGKYVTQLSDLKDVLPEITEKGAEDVCNFIYSNWTQAVHNTFFGNSENRALDEESVTLYKMVLTTPKDTSDTVRSRLWCVYTVTVSDSELAEPTTLYFGVCYRNLTLDEQGRLPENISCNTRTNGYTTFEGLLQSKIESYNLKVEQSE